MVRGRDPESEIPDRSADRPGMTSELDMSIDPDPELHAGRGRLRRGVPRSKKSFLVKPKHAGEQGRRHLLDASVVFLDRVVEEAARQRSCFDNRTARRQLLEVRVGFQVRIGFRQRDQPPSAPESWVLAARHPAPVPAPRSPVARLDHLFQRAVFMRRTALRPSDHVRGSNRGELPVARRCRRIDRVDALVKRDERL